MKKLFSIIAATLFAASLSAITVRDICGRYDGDLDIAGEPFPSKSIFLFPGVMDSTVTFVLPDFDIAGRKLGNIVLPNIPVDENGKLTLDSTTMYLDTLSIRTGISILNEYVSEDSTTTYSSVVSPTDVQVVLSIAVPELPEIIVIFQGQAVRNCNYAITNGGVEGEWTNYEPEGWHSFHSADGLLNNMVVNNTFQFTQSTEVRPGSKGSYSALLSSYIVLKQKANGNMTNGRINAGSTNAANAEGNYNFSDPDSVGYNTPLQGRPDSIVFWAKYLPADRDCNNEVNKARMNAVLTTNARYQDPESANFAEAKIASAAINYSATADFGWQRLSVPFTYDMQDTVPAYILTTFTTNMTPGGGSSYTSGSGSSKVTVLDSVYIDDVELVYNRQLTSFAINEDTLGFSEQIATVAEEYCDSCAKYIAEAQGMSAKTFLAFDAIHRCIFIYVIADDYAQSGNYNLYRVDFTDTDTTGISTKDDEQGIELIQGGRKAGQCTKVLRNGQLYIIREGHVYNTIGYLVK